MKMPTAHPDPRRFTMTDTKPLRFRAELPAVIAPAHPALPATAAHDFLVPNPRPDLVSDVFLLRLIEW
jgi:hypothetical protein